MPSKPPAESILNFDVDTYLNPIIPPSQLHRIPKTISHFLGHRNHQPSEPPHLISYTLAYLATVTGLCLVGGVYNHAPGVTKWQPPTARGFARRQRRAQLQHNPQSAGAAPQHHPWPHTLRHRRRGRQQRLPALYPLPAHRLAGRGHRVRDRQSRHVPHQHDPSARQRDGDSGVHPDRCRRHGLDVRAARSDRERASVQCGLFVQQHAALVSDALEGERAGWASALSSRRLTGKFWCSGS
ncbi:hypothetical protein D0864_11579 [Hortaea werneckii]|uniref:Uncharacterized protein n=1 Tax=Hortaea werneckii TaxID=91943 RepID=A0A3M7DSZ3_HORWE|nr:hypothetical protein D0864_11579 [Hortaea werneckii]